MSDARLPFQRLDVYCVAKELAQRVQGAKIGDAELRDQATRAAKSAFLNLSEGLPSDAPGIRRTRFTTSNNSLHEVVAAVDLSASLGLMQAGDAEAVQALALRFKRMLRALLHAK